MSHTIRFPKDSADNIHFRKIKKEVDDFLNGIPHRHMRIVRARSLFFPVLYIILYLCAIYFRNSTGLFFLFYISMGITMLFIFLNMVHDAVHGTIFERKWQNNLILYFFDVIGANSYIWKKRHKMLHHAFQNVSGWDSDIEQATLFKIFPHEEKRKIHNFQHILIFFFYPLYLVNWVFVRDFKDYFKKTQMIRKVCTISPIEYFKLLFFKILFVTYMVFIPYMLGIPLLIATAAMFFMLILSGTLALVFLLTPHTNINNQFPLPDGEGRLSMSWLKHQFATTNDVDFDNWITRNLLGNFNYHIAHHLFPNINSAYTPKITGIIKSYADEHHLGYRSYSLGRALKYHFQLIRSNAINCNIMDEDM